ncbi:MAG: alkaline phosphatase family protein [Clostridia bacterium]|nr:alkaline phosphatase family protein [Clostridia bacterium]
MSEKVILILVDGMRPDGMMGCENLYAEKLLSESTYSLTARTVVPSVTLPCHMSLFHSVDPDRHGVTTNTYVPQVRPIKGMFDQFSMFGKKCAFFYTWEELRDLSRPDCLYYSLCINQHKYTDTDTKITDAAIDYINSECPDFLFLYLGETDEVGGHSCGWMSEQYMKSVSKTLSCVEKLKGAISEEYTVILLADHGGHDRTHGTVMPEDMTIPICISGRKFDKGRVVEDLSIKDVATTVAALLEVPAAPEWEGKVISFNK